MSENLYCEKHKRCFSMYNDGIFHCPECDIEMRKKEQINEEE